VRSEQAQSSIAAGDGKNCRGGERFAGRRAKKRKKSAPVRLLRRTAIVASALGTVAAYGHPQELPEANMLDRIDHHLGTLRTAANLRAYRQELLASNMANADTPQYKARDFDFKAALDGALSGRSAGAAMSRTSPRHLAAAGANVPPGVNALYRTEFQANVDGNTVNMDVERSAFAENAVQLETALTLMREEFRRLQTAIQGQ